MNRMLIAGSAVALMALANPAAAQNATNGSQASSQPSSNSNQNLAAAQKIQQDLQKAGFTDVKVVAESFVVQAKSKDGNPVLMTIGPHGMSVFEAMNVNPPDSKSGSSSQGTTGSNSSRQGTSK
ncbi:hypothetical protein [Bradyrhizobium sp. WU425]|uniref:hypothetical protein n=1 Tax=Bradyrhizobium sp. WU425 TaxID=187029 RepID=UPI001E3B8914|nr:hypothetical protein [Bradyrhizobium canariense]UFW72987.1 hypothetical protein BcanWU425_04245 [Bradyrhizobium canariense]